MLILLCILYLKSSLARTFPPSDVEHNYRIESRHQSFNRGRSITTTPRPILQQYWQSFVRNLPTLPPLSWNITSPIGNLFNTGTQQIIETPVAMHMIKGPNNRKTKASKRKPYKRNKNRKGTQSRNYYSTYDGGYGNTYQQIQLQPLGLDYNGIMHFYEPSSGQYYALQVESQSSYYQSPYKNQYANQYINQYNQYYGYDDDDGFYYPDNSYNSGYGYVPGDVYHSDHENGGYDSVLGDYDNDYESSNEDMEYDDGVELVDNWGYSDEEIFADRKLKGGSDNIDTIAKRIVKIQKQLLKPETEEDVKFFLSGGQKMPHKNEKVTTKKETKKHDVESVRNVLGAFMKNDDLNRKKENAKTIKNLQLESRPREQNGYYIFPANFWL